MASVIKDIIEGGASITLDRGWELRRVITVIDVAGDGDKKIKTAYETEGCPQLGEGHPSRASALLYQMLPEIIDNTTVKFTALYCDYWWSWTINPPQIPSMSTIQTGASVTQIDTNKDYDGTVMYVPRSGKDSQGLTISKLIAEPTISITKIEAASPLTKAIIYVGKANTATAKWGAAGTWLCTGITGYSWDGGVTYEVNYTFVRRMPNWGIVGAWIDPTTGRPPADITEGNGLKTWQIYAEENFDTLGLL